MLNVRFHHLAQLGAAVLRPPGAVRRRFTIAGAIAAVMLGGWSNKPVEEGPTRIVVVHSKKAEPFEAAESAFRKLWRGGTKIESLVLDDQSASRFAGTPNDGSVAFVALGSDAATRLARNLPDAVPLAFCMVSDPEAAGVTSRLNTAGVRMDVPVAAQVALIRDALPDARRIGVLFRSKGGKGAKAVEQLTAAVPSGWSVVAVELTEGMAVADAIATLTSSDIHLVWTYADSSLFDSATVRTLLLETIRRRIPVFGYSTAFVRAGALLGIGIDPEDQGTQAAEALKDLLATGSEKQPAADEPRFSFALNRIVAEKLSIPLSDSVVRRAKVVFDGD